MHRAGRSAGADPEWIMNNGAGYIFIIHSTLSINHYPLNIIDYPIYE